MLARHRNNTDCSKNVHVSRGINPEIAPKVGFVLAAMNNVNDFSMNNVNDFLMEGTNSECHNALISSW